MNLQKDFEEHGPELIVSKHINEMLEKRVVNIERQCWSNSEYSNQECLEVTGIPESTESKDLEQTVLKVFAKLEVMADSANVFTG